MDKSEEESFVQDMKNRNYINIALETDAIVLVHMCYDLSTCYLIDILVHRQQIGQMTPLAPDSYTVSVLKQYEITNNKEFLGFATGISAKYISALGGAFAALSFD